MISDCFQPWEVKIQADSEEIQKQVKKVEEHMGKIISNINKCSVNKIGELEDD